MQTLLVVDHTPSPAMPAMVEVVLAGARDDAIEGVDVVARPALAATAADVLAADGCLLGPRPTSVACPARSSTSSTRSFGNSPTGW